MANHLIDGAAATGSDNGIGNGTDNVADNGGCTIRELVDLQARVRGDAVYLIAPESGLRLSFGELQQSARLLTHYLAGCGIWPGAKVALLMPNGYQTCRLFIGAMYGGYCVTPLNLLAQPAQLEYVLEHSDAAIVFVAPTQLPRLQQALAHVKRQIMVVVAAVEAREFLPPPVAGAVLVPPAPDQDALMMYTSGTTGQPKGVLLTQRAVVAGAQFVSAAHALGPQDRAMACLPLYHINAQIVTATAPLVHGGSLVLPQRFSVSGFWDMVAQQGCTWINAVPTIISYLLNSPSPAPSVDLGRVRFCRSASAPLSPAHHLAFEEKFKIGIIETMGLTETAGPCFSNPVEPAQRRLGSPGRAFGNQAQIAAADGQALAAGVRGEIMVRGPNLMRGYYKDAQQSAEALTADGWLHTGDLGYLDRDGFLFVTGRLKELIIKGGENIAPREIDEVLLTHPAVLEAAAVGMADEHYGQDILACVVLRPGQVIDDGALRRFCQERLGPYKTPRLIRVVEQLPRGPSGKVQRLRLLDLPGLLADAQGAAGS